MRKPQTAASKRPKRTPVAARVAQPERPWNQGLYAARRSLRPATATLTRAKAPAQKRGKNDSISDNIVNPERAWYEGSNSGPRAAGRGTLGGSTTRPHVAASGSVPSSESTSGSDAVRTRRRSARPATTRRVRAKVVLKASGGVLRPPTDASIKRSPRARGP